MVYRLLYIICCFQTTKVQNLNDIHNWKGGGDNLSPPLFSDHKGTKNPIIFNPLEYEGVKMEIRLNAFTLAFRQIDE